MNSLLQTASLLIGSEEAITELSQKENAVILAVSDSHGQPERLKQILLAFGESADLLTFSGDGAEDLLMLLEASKKNRKLAKVIPPVIAMAQGNGDEDLYPVSFNPSDNSEKKENWQISIPKIITVKAAGMNILVTHGHLFGVYAGTSDLEKQAAAENADLVLYGHSHISARYDNDTNSIINPGSCSLPRRGLPPSCAVIKIPGEQERISCTFYEMKISLSEGFSFVPFSPAMRGW